MFAIYQYTLLIFAFLKFRQWRNVRYCVNGILCLEVFLFFLHIDPPLMVFPSKPTLLFSHHWRKYHVNRHSIMFLCSNWSIYYFFFEIYLVINQILTGFVHCVTRRKCVSRGSTINFTASTFFKSSRFYNLFSISIVFWKLMENITSRSWTIRSGGCFKQCRGGSLRQDIAILECVSGLVTIICQHTNGPRWY